MIQEIKGFENITGYEVCEDGTVFSYKKNEVAKLKPYRNTKEYLMVDLTTKKRAVKVHRLVALAFIPNEFNKPQVNHKDGNKKNNHINNLEWVTNAENQKHAYRTGLNVKKTGDECYNYNKEHKTCKKVLQFDLSGNFIKEYLSLAMAAREINAKSYSQISKACKDWNKTVKGFKWKFKDE